MIKSNRGFTLLELLISIVIIGIIMSTMTGIYMNMEKEFFDKSDKMKILYNKQRVINLINKDLIFGTKVEILNSGADLKLTQLDATVVQYSFTGNKLNRNGVEMISGLSGVTFDMKEDVKVIAETKGVGGNSITLATTGAFISSGATLLGGTALAEASGTIVYKADNGTVTVNGTTFTYNAGDPSGPQFATIDDLVADIDALSSVKANVKNKYIELNGTLTGKTNNTNINFNYVFEETTNKWKYDYIYPDS